MKRHPPSNEISQKIKRIRGNLSQTEFAKRVGINRSLISSYESGQKSPSLASLEKLADHAGVSIEYLLGKEGVPSHKLTPEEDKVVYQLRKLSPESRTLIINLLKKLTEHISSKQNEKAKATK